MNVASLELCKKLFELSGWKDGVEHVYYSNAGELNAENVWPMTAVFDKPGNVPAYDLGYLLRKLPTWLFAGGYFNLTVRDYAAEYCDDEEPGETWEATYTANKLEVQYADTPEDAAAALAIELFKQGILEKAS